MFERSRRSGRGVNRCRAATNRTMLSGWYRSVRDIVWPRQ
ncbi:hypothetical protein RHOER0001_1094 [Rhodococcus erythropolis SK121]|nr:hypothetical protein RHOER0001_1094 [Rhodococcus erythropolis SK121]